ncbi:NAD(P)/FAD-dependent oxidoreductase [Pseudoclavibacter helvolus]|uniref:NADPH-dependent 2,4-dienoyl-CoA reductase/sulfur reductase-like enzyme n=1 Tax=Pseudoclavibacter helvolus TaxID=255205 RepID=A0A7W4YEV2_9MICO|nr:FAD/NAD(P)-binding oxidoreductase [Pseudoclavibacter helvolus]MBB2957587.1 NADPH-dependent 2,4-dienoyl-CoA reductase/sulfur reductase-like enzyme [Pseudoclavibacter helvolus]
MSAYDYLIIGGGMVADAAARGIRERDTTGTIGILSADVDEPYARPALSKKLWVDPDFTWEQTPLGTSDATGAEISLGTLVTGIDRETKTVTTDGGETLTYGKLLLATGSKPVEIDVPESPRILFFRSASDYRWLRELSEGGAHGVVVGGGYIGTEIAAALAQNDVEVDLVFPEEVLGASTFPSALAERFQELFVEHGVGLVPGRRVDGVRAEVRVPFDESADELVGSEGDAEGERGGSSPATSSSGVTVVFDNGAETEADFVVFGLGAKPVVDLAEEAGLVVDEGGVVVDELLRTIDPSIWAAGDIAVYPDPVLGQTRVEHVDNATEMGAAAGRSMAGAADPYSHTPYFYSMVFGTRWEAVGTLDPALEVLEAELPESGESDESRVIYFRDESGAPVGVLLWDVGEDEALRDAARTVIDDGVTSTEELRARIR